MSGSVRALVRAAIAEDIGPGDWTTLWTVARDAEGTGRIIAKASGVVAGVDPAGQVFGELDPGLHLSWRRRDGDGVAAGDEILGLERSLRSILSGERTALNVLGRLSGIATLARRYADAVEGTGVRVVDTRKTTPGWRVLEKAAVLAGGCDNHRHGLYDMVLIKENHIRAAGDIAGALDAVQAHADARGLEVEIEVRDLREFAQAVDRRPDRILLDNMLIADLREAVRRVGDTDAPQPLLEASGAVSLETVREIAESGVDVISVGALTHSAPPLDLSLLVDEVCP